MKSKILIVLLICCFSAKSVVMACSYDYGLAMDAGSTYVDRDTHNTLHTHTYNLISREKIGGRECTSTNGVKESTIRTDQC